MTTNAGILIVAIAGGVLGPALSRQQDHAPPGRDMPPRHAEIADESGMPPPPPGEPTTLRDRLIEHRERVDDAIRALDDGQPARAVFRSLRDQSRWFSQTPRDDHRRPEARRLGVASAQIDIRQARERIKETYPDLHERLSKLDDTNPEMAQRVEHRLGARLLEITELMQHDPELAQLKQRELIAGMKVFETARDLRGAIEAGEIDQDEARERLEGILTEQLQIRVDIASLELKRVQEQLEDTTRRVAQLSARRDQEVDTMTRRMLERIRRAGPRGEREHRRGRDAQTPEDRPASKDAGSGDG